MIGGAHSRLIILSGQLRLRLMHEARGRYEVNLYDGRGHVFLGRLGTASRARHEGVDKGKHWGHWGWRNGDGACYQTLEAAAQALVPVKEDNHGKP